MKARTIRLVVLAVSVAVLGGLSVRPSHAASEGTTNPPPEAPKQPTNPQGTTSGCCGGAQPGN